MSGVNIWTAYYVLKRRGFGMIEYRYMLLISRMNVRRENNESEVDRYPRISIK